MEQNSQPAAGTAARVPQQDVDHGQDSYLIFFIQEEKQTAYVQ